MPRESPYAIVLTPTEDAELRTMARKYTSPYYLVVRAKAILLAAQGHTNAEIASRLDMQRQVVSKWRKRFLEQRLEGLTDQPRPGRPRTFSPSDGDGSEGSGL